MTHRPLDGSGTQMMDWIWTIVNTLEPDLKEKRRILGEF